MAYTRADLFTEAFYRSRRGKFRRHTHYPVTRLAPHRGTDAEVVWLPQDPARRWPVVVGPDPSGPLPATRRWLGLVLRALPVHDDLRTWPDVATARHALARRFGGLLSQATESAPDAPLALARLVTEGIGAHRLKAAPGGYEVDVSALADLSVRPGFTPYGARLWVSRSLDAVRVGVDGRWYTSSDPGFPRARDRFEASLLVQVTVVDHMLRSHLQVAGGLVRALRSGLPADHDLRVALMPFTFNVARMNRAALDLLHGPGGYFHRCFALDALGLDTLVTQALQEEPLPSGPPRERAPGPGLPFFEEAQGWWEALERYIQAVVDALLVGPQVAGFAAALGVDACHASVVRALVDRVFDGTVGHRQVGNMGAYVQDPAWMPTFTRPGPREGTLLAIRPVVQRTVLSFISTRVHAPRFTDDIASVLPAGPIRDAWQRLDADLVAWESGLDARNRVRPRPYEVLRRDAVPISAAV